MKYGQECMFVFKLTLVEGMYTMVKPDGAGFCQQLVLCDGTLYKPEFVLYFYSLLLNRCSILCFHEFYISKLKIHQIFNVVYKLHCDYIFKNNFMNSFLKQ
jgi:hypothetical protein